jgi:glycosyltransferase involved in cell wall biosynthesis
LFVSLKDELLFNLTVPAKIQFYMSQGKPVLAMLNGDGAEIIEKANCGLAVPANDANALKIAIEEFLRKEKSELDQMGNNGKYYYEKHFQKNHRIQQLDDILRQMEKKE